MTQFRIIPNSEIDLSWYTIPLTNIDPAINGWGVDDYFVLELCVSQGQTVSSAISPVHDTINIYKP